MNKNCSSDLALRHNLHYRKWNKQIDTNRPIQTDQNSVVNQTLTKKKKFFHWSNCYRCCYNLELRDLYLSANFVFSSFGIYTMVKRKDISVPRILLAWQNFFRDRNGRERNQSPKGKMWSAIPDALLCMIVKLGEGKHEAGSGPNGDEVL